jgi:hypothetical protein
VRLPERFALAVAEQAALNFIWLAVVGGQKLERGEAFEREDLLPLDWIEQLI